MKICPRCLKTLVPDSVHTCTPTPYARVMEAELERLRLIEAGTRDSEALVSELHSQLDTLNAKLERYEHGEDFNAVVTSCCQKEKNALSARVKALGTELDALDEENYELECSQWTVENLAAHDEAVRRDALEQAWERVLLASVDTPYSMVGIRAAIFGIPPSTDTPIQEKK